MIEIENKIIGNNINIYNIYVYTNDAENIPDAKSNAGYARQG